LAWTVLTVGQFAAVIAMLQRSSLGVATTEAGARFGITAATLAAFSMVQLLVYAVMAGAQTMFAVATKLPLAFAARVALGVGDALTFISVMRLVPAWFPPERSAKLTTAIGPVNQLGFVLSAVGFAALPRRGRVDPVIPGCRRGQRRLRGAGAGPAARLAAGPPPRIPLGDARATAGQGVRQALGGARHSARFLAAFHDLAYGHGIRGDVGATRS